MIIKIVENLIIVEPTEEFLRTFISLIKVDRNPYSNPKGHQSVPRTIYERWNSWNLPVELIEFNHFGFTGRNLFVAPKDPTKPTILLIAHHDTIPNCVGIDDNGSGMAVVDRLAFLMSEGKLSANVSFALIDFEENDPRIWKLFDEWKEGKNIDWGDMGHLDDSEFYNYKNYIHKHLKNITSFAGTRKLLDKINNLNLDIQIVLNFESVGYTSENQDFPPDIPIEMTNRVGDFILAVGNVLSESFVGEITKIDPEYFFPMVVPMSGKSIPDTRRSDHSVFWDDNTAAIMLTDTANFRNPHYHKPSDDIIHYDFIMKLIQNITKFLSS